MKRRACPPIRQIAAVLGLIALTACGSQAPMQLDDDEQIVRGVLGALTSDGKAICVDSHTRGHALELWRDVVASIRPVRDGLGWQPLEPLRPPQVLDGKKLYQIELRNQRKELVRPDAAEPMLSRDDAVALSNAARSLTMPLVDDDPVRISSSWAPKSVTVRWWVTNRFVAGCIPTLLSNVARTRDTAFVMVQTDHWGTVFASRKTGAAWRPIAQWSRWLY